MRLLTLYCAIFISHSSIGFAIIYDSMNNKLLYAKILNEGTTKLAYIGDEIKKHSAALGDVSQIVTNVTVEYAVELNNLFNVMEKHKLNYELERQYFYLYIVESCNEIFSSKLRMLLNAMDVNDYTKYNDEQKSDKHMQLTYIKKVIIDEKKSNLMYICMNLDVCRTFPAFSNYLVDLVDEILKLPYTKFIDIIKLLKDVIAVKLGFFQKIMDESIAFQINDKLTKIAERPEDMRRFLKTLKFIMLKKYKLFKTKNETIRATTKAVRLLIDIVDKAFETIGEEAIFIEFDNIIRALKSWAIDEIRNMERILTNSCNHIFDILNFYWDSDTKKEVKLLIELYMTDNKMSESSILYDDLLYKGSIFFKNELFFNEFDFNVIATTSIPPHKNKTNRLDLQSSMNKTKYN